MKRTEPLILTVRFLVIDRTKMGTVTYLYLRTAKRTTHILALHASNRRTKKRYGKGRDRGKKWYGILDWKRYGHGDKFGRTKSLNI